MQYVLDGLALVFVIFFFLSGWHKGILISFLSGVRLLVATVVAYLIARYLGGWLAPIINRPRIILVPSIAIFVFAAILFLFKYIFFRIRLARKELEEEKFKRPIWRCFIGGVINLLFGTFVLAEFFWLAELFVVIVGGRTLPGAEEAKFSQFSRRMVYEIAYAAIPKEGRESQVASMARMISHPGSGMKKLKEILDAKSFQAVLKDEDFRKELLSGDPKRIEDTPVMQELFKDQKTIDALYSFGIISSTNQVQLCEQLSVLGKNEVINSSIESLQTKKLLEKDKIMQLIRDPDFDTIMGELLK